jgi:hypothetical protein
VSVTALQVDDNFGHGTSEFLTLEEKASNRFICKPRVIIEVGDMVTFNGSEIVRSKFNVFVMRQQPKLRALETAASLEQLVSVRAAMQYFATSTRPDLAAPCQLLASRIGFHADVSIYTAMNRLVETANASASNGLTFVPLDLTKVRVVVFTDASFANAEKYKSQLGFVICLADDNNNANIVHFGSSKCKRVTRSVMAAELHGLVLGFDNAFSVREMVSEILGRKIPIDAYVDSKTVFDTVTKLGATLEKRLQIDVAALQESHLKGELRSLHWIPSAENCADALTKEPYQRQSALLLLMSTNTLQVSPTGWVHRSERYDEHAIVDNPSSYERRSPSVE